MSRAAIAAVLLLSLSLSLGLAACGEKPQTASHRKADGHPSDGPASAYTAGTWKAGDAAAWDAQMRTRAQGQNEYSRTGSPP
jgi:hypothetical protein